MTNPQTVSERERADFERFAKLQGWGPLSFTYSDGRYEEDDTHYAYVGYKIAMFGQNFAARTQAKPDVVEREVLETLRDGFSVLHGGLIGLESMEANASWRRTYKSYIAVAESNIAVIDAALAALPPAKEQPVELVERVARAMFDAYSPGGAFLTGTAKHKQWKWETHREKYLTLAIAALTASPQPSAVQQDEHYHAGYQVGLKAATQPLSEEEAVKVMLEDVRSYGVPDTIRVGDGASLGVYGTASMLRNAYRALLTHGAVTSGGVANDILESAREAAVDAKHHRETGEHLPGVKVHQRGAAFSTAVDDAKKKLESLRQVVEARLAAPGGE